MTKTKFILFDPVERRHFLPFLFAQPFAFLKVGAFTFEQRWAFFLKQKLEILAPTYLQIEINFEATFFTYINPLFVPEASLIEVILSLKEGESLWQKEHLIAFHTKKQFFSTPEIFAQKFENKKEYEAALIHFHFAYDVLQNLEAIMNMDFAHFPKINLENLKKNNRIIGDQIFVEEGAIVEAASLNSSTGSIYIGKNAVIMEGSLIRGPFFLSEGSTVKMGTQIYGPVSVAEHCKIAGEISASVFQAYSNKAHGGFLGSSWIGQWCNLGADTQNSNLKNNYAKVSVYDFENAKKRQTDLQFLGVLMGDHNRTAIGTLFNTATTTGIHNHIFGLGFQETYIPSFSFGTIQGNQDYLIEKALETTAIVMERRGKILDQKQRAIYRYLFEKRKEADFGINFAV